MVDDTMVERFEGCLVGGAIGDALGYPVEFDSYEGICGQFGQDGIRAYSIHPWAGCAQFSDDTQMTLFSASGLLQVGAGASDEECNSSVYGAYLDWLHTQDRMFAGHPGTSPLLAEEQLYSRRAPGNTCLSALYGGEMGLMEQPINTSKGCGGVMRVAPMGLYFEDPTRAVHVAAMAAAITHGHPLGYISAAALAYIVNRCVHSEAVSLAAVIDDCASQLPGWFDSERFYADSMARQLQLAASLAENDTCDHDDIVRLGEGWIGDEALAIAVYCCLRHHDSFDGAVIAAVNHGGDSDSTGAIAGNIMGAWLGMAAIGQQWLEQLELRELLTRTADELCEALHINS
ncbi:MAG: ADP-ribosylglycohydrolase family protein [Atopobiaceae bacterium]|nr:ADP-ribosylglycohydrolase family protein [Atopobiaceae bacterium]